MDPATFHFLLLGGTQITVAAAKWLQRRNASKASQSQSPSAADQKEQFFRDVFLVLATLGDVCVGLGVVDNAELPEALNAVRRSLAMKGPEFATIFDDELELVLQYAVAIGMFFCAACWPMHIYKGFGALVLNQPLWDARQDSNQKPKRRFAWDKQQPAPETPQEPVLAMMDNCIALLKASSTGHTVLTQVPTELSHIQPDYTSSLNEKHFKDARSWLLDIFSEVKKRGPPQPNDKSFEATEILIGYTSWTKPYTRIWAKEKDDPDLHDACCSQRDPGRLLYAYTLGKQLDLQPGQLLIPIDRTECILLKWLEGLRGVTFRLMTDSEFDKKHPKLSKTNRWIVEWKTVSTNITAVRDEHKVQERTKEEARQKEIRRQNPAPPPCPHRPSQVSNIETKPLSDSLTETPTQSPEGKESQASRSPILDKIKSLLISTGNEDGESNGTAFKVVENVLGALNKAGDKFSSREDGKGGGILETVIDLGGGDSFTDALS